MKKIIIYTIFLTIPFWSYCQNVSETTAIKVAEKVLKIDKPNLKNPVFEKTIPVGLNNDTLYFIFTYPNGGFSIVSADSSAPPLLGHCKKGRYAPENMPPGLIYLLNKYKYWINGLRKNKVKQTKHIKEQWAGYLNPDLINKESSNIVSPLLKTKWGQKNGYNQFCPSDCYAGCTAVAMAQILKYWACRVNPTGSISYSGSGYFGASANFGATYYDWKDMSLDIPDTNNALLIFHAGASCQTHYHTDGSSSTPGRAKDGFVNFWGMNPNANVKWRISHLSNWNDMIKNELFQGRPVLYSGGSISGGGHSWVIDGYANGLFYCNWGWYGNFDGPFSIGEFNTPNGSFNQLESAIFNVYPVKSEGVAEPELTAQTFTYNPNGYTITIPDAFGATSYQWSCSQGTIQGSGTSATLFSDCNSTVSVRAFNSRCQIYSNTNSKLIAIKYGPITGPSSICSSGSIFMLNNRPSNLSVNWIHSSNLTYVSGQGTDNYTVAAVNSYVSGTGWIKAVISSDCTSDTLEKDVWVGKPGQPITDPPGYPTYQMTLGQIKTIRVVSAPGNPYEYVWNITGSITKLSGGGTQCTVEARTTGIGNYYVNSINECGTSMTGGGTVSVSSGGGGGLLLSPNPADNNLTVEINDNKTPDNLNNTNSKTSELRVYDKMMNLKMKKTFRGRKTQINVRNLKQGVYILQIISGKKNYKKEIMVRHH